MNGNKTIDLLDWGWTKLEGVLAPIKTADQPAPEELLKIIFCSCKRRCGSACDCRRVGLFCNSACITCSGDNCNNSAPIMDNKENEFEAEDKNDDEVHWKKVEMKRQKKTKLKN